MQIMFRKDQIEPLIPAAIVYWGERLDERKAQKAISDAEIMKSKARFFFKPIPDHQDMLVWECTTTIFRLSDLFEKLKTLPDDVQFTLSDDEWNPIRRYIESTK